MSATNIDYELFCFLRWFYIRDFVVKHNIESFICLDSDVLVFSDLTEALKPFRHFSIAIERESMPPFTYFGNRKAIVDFCDFITRQYMEPNYIKRLEEGWEYHKPKNWGGICDMVIFEFYFNENPESTGRLDVIVNNAVFDYHIRGKNGFEMQGENKKVKWKNDSPYGFYLESKKWIRFHGIHYGGEAKALMYKHYSGGGYYRQRLSEYIMEIRNKYQLKTKIKSFLNQRLNNFLNQVLS
jgi:hypothetical protein